MKKKWALIFGRGKTLKLGVLLSSSAIHFFLGWTSFGVVWNVEQWMLRG